MATTVAHVIPAEKLDCRSTITHATAETLNFRWRFARRPRAGAAARWLLGGALGFVIALLPDGSARAGLHQWSSGGPASTGPVNSIAVDPTNPLVVYAGTGVSGVLAGTVFKSTNGGQSWDIKNGNLPSGFYRGFAIHPQAPATIYAASSTGGVFKSTNGADSWTPKNTSPAPGSPLTVVLDPQNPAIVFAGTAGLKPNNLFRSANGGDNWEPVGNDLGNSSPIVNAVAVDPHNSSIVYAGTQDGVFKSTNGGQNWSPMNNGFAPDPSPIIKNALVIDPQESSIIYAGTGGFGVWKSVDGAVSWTPANTGLNDFLIEGMVMDPQRRNVLYLVTATGGAYRSTDSAQSWSPLNIGLGSVPLTSIGISQTGTCVHAGTNNNQSSHVFDYALVADCSLLPPGVPPLVAAVLPSSRSVQVGQAHPPATAFVTIINPASSPATGVGIKLGSAIPANLNFQTTDPATNLVTGTPGVPADLPGGGSQTYVIALTPTGSMPATEVAFLYAGENTLGPTATLVGINTLLLSASFNAIPDVVALAATITDDGITNIVNGSGAFAVATVNVGSSASISVSADTGNVNLPVGLFVCQTDPANGQCISALAQSISVQINANETPTFTVFAAATGAIPFDPAANRAFVRFKDAGNVTRGATSVALRTL